MPEKNLIQCGLTEIEDIAEQLEICVGQLRHVVSVMKREGWDTLDIAHHTMMIKYGLPNMEKFGVEAVQALRTAKASRVTAPILYDNAGETGLESAVADGMGKKRPKKKPAKKKPTTKKE